MKFNISPRAKNILEWVYCIVIAIVLALLFRYFIGTPTVVRQPSMYNTLEEGQRLILNRWVRTVNGKYERGDIITFEAPSSPVPSLFEIDTNNPVAKYEYKPKGIFAKFNYYVLEFSKTSYIKRVIGLPGEHVEIKGGKVYIDGQILEENYLDDSVKTYIPVGGIDDFIVPEGYVFAMGDNRNGSSDCRLFGCVPIEKIEGRVSVRIWPLNKIGKIDK